MICTAESFFVDVDSKNAFHSRGSLLNQLLELGKFHHKVIILQTMKTFLVSMIM